MLPESGPLRLLGTAAILASELRQGFAERPSLDLVFSAERSRFSYSQHQLFLWSIRDRGQQQGRWLGETVV